MDPNSRTGTAGSAAVSIVAAGIGLARSPEGRRVRRASQMLESWRIPGRFTRAVQPNATGFLGPTCGEEPRPIAAVPF